ncbi:ABC transporter permease [Micromonospora sp. NPDC047620]|uniref:ABC transporter permease n=1 Tax=Micromonospora sp. NPDC047620 TaxID=3364251 RepID=UPI00371534CE
MSHLVRAEFRRLFATRLWIWAVAAAVVIGGGLVGLLTVIGPENVNPPLPGLDTEAGIRAVLGLAGLGVIVPALFGATAVTSEYRHRTISATFLFAPRRWSVLAAKLLVYLVAGVAYGLITTIAAGIALYAGMAVRDIPAGAPLDVVVSLLLRLVVAMAAYTVLGVGIGALVRNQVLALAGLGAYLYMGENLLLFVPGVNMAYPFLPGGATAALTNFTALTQVADDTTGAAPQLLSPQAGAGLLIAYALAAALLAVVLPLRRDVT